MPSYAANRAVWVRLDDGNLSEGKHTVKITTTSTSAGSFVLQGWATYSSKAPTTCARSLICGKNSYAVGIDESSDSPFTFTGSWTSADEAQSFCGRYIATQTQTDYMTITTPTNVKAIYLITTIGTTRGEAKISLGGASSNVRYINTDTNNVTQGSSIQPLYDAYMDKISLDSQTSSRIVVLVELNYLERIVKNSGEFVNETSLTPLKVRYIFGFSNKSWKLVDFVSGL